MATIVVSAANVLARGAGLLSTVICAVVLSPTQLGYFALATVSANLIAAVGLLGLPPLVTREVATADSLNDSAAVSAGSLYVAMAMTLVAGCVFLAVCNPYGPAPLRLSSVVDLYLTLAWAVALGVTPLLVAIGNGNRAFRFSSGLNIFRAFLVALGAAIGGYATSSATGAIVGSLMGEWLALTTGLLYMVKRRWFRVASIGSTLARCWKAVVVPALPAGVASLFVQGALWTGQFFLSQTSDGIVAVGLFLLMTRTLLLITLVANGVSTAILPLLSVPGQDPADSRQTEKLGYSLALGSAVVGSAALAATLPKLIILFDPVYAGSSATIIVMCASGVIVAANNLLSSVAVSRGCIYRWVASDVVLAVVLLLSSLLLVPKFTGLGLAIAYSIGYLSSVLVLAAKRGERNK